MEANVSDLQTGRRLCQFHRLFDTCKWIPIWRLFDTCDIALASGFSFRAIFIGWNFQWKLWIRTNNHSGTLMSGKALVIPVRGGEGAC